MTAELWAFAAAVVCGVLAVVLWNAAEAFKNVFGARAAAEYVSDILWWICVCSVFCICMWQILNLRIRFFEFIGVGLGAFLCAVTISAPVKYLFGLFFEIILKIIQFILKILLTPWTFLYKILIVEKLGKNRSETGKAADNESPEKKIG